LDFDDDSQNQQDDDISEGEFSDHEGQLDDNHTLGSSESIVDKDEEEDESADADDNDSDGNNHDNSHDNRSDSD